MGIYLTFRIINIVLALLSIPPSIYILRLLAREGKVVETQQSVLNKILTALFTGMVIGSFLNATISTISLFGHREIASSISICRSIYVSGFFSLFTWVIYLYQKRNGNK